MENITLTELGNFNKKELKGIKKYHKDRIECWKGIQKTSGELRHQYSAQAIIRNSTQFINAIDELLQQA